jgi:hypothetical protein
MKRFGLERETEAIKKIIRTKSLLVMLQNKKKRIERERESEVEETERQELELSKYEGLRTHVV